MWEKGSDTPTADQSQYVAPLESWPPAPQQHGSVSQQHDYVPPVKRYKPPSDGTWTAWVILALGFLIPILALLVGMWAIMTRNNLIALAAFAVIVVQFAILI